MELKISPNDIRTVAALKKNSLMEISLENFEKKYAKEEIIKMIKRQRLKFQFLRFGQRIFKKILPQRIFIVSKKIILKILRKLKII